MYSGLLEFGIFLGGLFLGAFVREVARRIANRARPSVYVSNVAIGPKTDTDNYSFEIDIGTRAAIGRNPVLPNIDDSLTVASARKYVQEAKQKVAYSSALSGHIASLRDSPNVLDPSLPEKEKRTDILRKYVSLGRDIEMLETWALIQFRGEIPARYLEPHPAEWRDPTLAYVQVSTNSRFDLSEVDLDALYARVEKEKGKEKATEEKLRGETTNISRRFWIHLQEADLRWLLAKMHIISIGMAQDAERVIQAIEKVIAEKSAEHLQVDVHFSNDGARGYIVKPYGFLTVPSSTADDTALVMVPLLPAREAGIEDKPLVVGANTVIQARFISELPVDELNLKVANDDAIAVDGAMLRAMYDSKSIVSVCAFPISELGHDEVRSMKSERFEFGRPAISAVKRKLLSSLQPIS